MSYVVVRATEIYFGAFSLFILETPRAFVDYHEHPAS